MTFRCYGPLNDFLPIERRQVSFSVPFAGERSVKDAIESIDAAHVEVDLILVNGDPALFNALVSDGNRIAVFPWFRSIDLRETFIDGSFAPAKKGGAGVGTTKRGKGSKISNALSADALAIGSELRRGKPTFARVHPRAISRAIPAVAGSSGNH